MTWFLLRCVNTTLSLCIPFFYKLHLEIRSETVSALPVTAQRCRSFSFVAFQLPPSYEQVIKEINQVQVNSTNNNNAAATPRSTITSATQTDFPEEIDGDPPPSNTGNLSSLVLT